MRDGRFALAIALAIVGNSCNGATNLTGFLESSPSEKPIIVEIVSSFELGRLHCDTFRAFAQRGRYSDLADFYAVDNTDLKCRADIFPKLSLLSDAERTMVWFDTKDILNRTHYPGLASVAKDSLGFVQRFVAGPMQYKIRRGIWSGQDIKVDLIKAFMLSSDKKSSFFLGKSLDSATFSYSRVGGRSPSKFPIEIAIRKPNRETVPPSDTLGFGNAMGELSNELGIPLVLVPMESVKGSDWNGIRVSISDTASAIGGVVSGPDGEFIGGTAVFSPQKNSVIYRFTVKHELWHALGVGHAVGWCPSLMNSILMCATVNDPWFGVSQKTETGHFWFMYDVWETKRQTNAQYGIPNMHQGWRVLFFGLPFENIVTR